MAYRPTPALPLTYEGSLFDYVEQHVIRAQPALDVLVAWTEALLTYYSNPDPICLIRGPRKGELVRRGGLRVVHCDNSPGIWCWHRARDGEARPADLAALLSRGQVPVLAALKGAAKRDWEWNYATRALSSADRQFWKNKLKHCHILDARPRGQRLPAQALSLRNLAPLNHFLFPNGNKHADTQRVGWTEAGAASDLGESATVIAAIVHATRDRLPASGRAVQDELFRSCGATLPARPRDVRIRIAPKALSTTISSPPVGRGNTTQPARPARTTASGMTTRRSWTLNARHGYYVKTGETASVIELHLRHKRGDGSVVEVGTYRLDLPALVSRGVVTERHGVFDIKIVHEAGRFWLGVRRSPRLSLADLRVASGG